VILPGANFAESEGTYTNCERRIQHLHRAISLPAGQENWEIISALATSLGYPMHYPTVSSIYQEITQLVPLYQAAKDYESPEGTVQWPFLREGSFDFKDGLARLKQPEPSYSLSLIEAFGSLS